MHDIPHDSGKFPMIFPMMLLKFPMMRLPFPMMIACSIVIDDSATQVNAVSTQVST